MAPDAICAKIAEALNVDKDRINVASKAGDVQEWDSMGSMCLLLMLNREFGVTPAPDEMEQIQSAHGIIDIVNKRASGT
jgi:acyl carrier protein